jgi:hypothetical protein
MAIAALLKHIHKSVSLNDQLSQLPQGLGSWFPGARILTLGKGQDYLSVNLVGLGAPQLGFGKGGYLGRVDNTNHHLGKTHQLHRQSLRVDPGRLHTEVKDIIGGGSAGFLDQALHSGPGKRKRTWFLPRQSHDNRFLTHVQTNLKSLLGHNLLLAYLTLGPAASTL